MEALWFEPAGIDAHNRLRGTKRNWIDTQATLTPEPADHVLEMQSDLGLDFPMPARVVAFEACDDDVADIVGALEDLRDHMLKRRRIVILPRPHHSTAAVAAPPVLLLGQSIPIGRRQRTSPLGGGRVRSPRRFNLFLAGHGALNNRRASSATRCPLQRPTIFAAIGTCELDGDLLRRSPRSSHDHPPVDVQLISAIDPDGAAAAIGYRLGSRVDRPLATTVVAAMRGKCWVDALRSTVTTSVGLTWRSWCGAVSR